MASLATRWGRVTTGRAALGALVALPLLIGGALAQETTPSAVTPEAVTQPAQSSPASPAPATQAPASPAPTSPAPAAPAASEPPTSQPPAASQPTTVFPSGQPSSIPPLGSAAPNAAEPAPSQSPSITPSTPTATAPAALDATVPPIALEAAEAPDAAGNATLPHDLSPWGMFMAADYVVKAVMVGLAFASVVTWTIWLAKVLELTGAKTRAASGVRKLHKADGLPIAENVEASGWKRGPVAAMVRAAAEERARSGGLPGEGVKERVATALQRIEARAGRRMTRGTGLLATIGSTAPFVGLFGTVWGIMNSFIGISQANTTNLAVVAPGIAEALLATAIGLVAAIPAVIVYNVFARAIAGYRAVLSDASAAVLQHLSRDLDRAKVTSPVTRAPYPRAAE